MKELSLVIHNSTGLHARPAKNLVNLAKKFESKISVQYGEKNANAKSLISLLKLGVKHQGQIQIQIQGPDEAAASDQIEEAVLSGLGESIEPSHSGNGSHAHQADDPSTSAEKNGSIPLPQHVIQGIGASAGTVSGPLFQLSEQEITLPTEFLGPAEEVTRLEKALSEAQVELNQLKSQLVANGQEEEAEIFAAHLEIISDDELLERVKTQISKQTNAAQAWHSAIETQADELGQSDNAILAGRAVDVRDAGGRVLGCLIPELKEQASARDITSQVILFAEDLTPSQTAQLDKEKILGIATSAGGPNAHSAIIARSLGIPAVVGLGQDLFKAQAGQTVVLNGRRGTLNLKPTSEEIQAAQKEREAELAAIAAARSSAHAGAKTQDDVAIEVVANAGSAKDAAQAVQEGADGIGLLRTEFVFLGAQEPPSEEEQVDIYSKILSVMGDRPVIIRTLDIGGDKPVPYLDVIKEENPFLGERGIRLTLNRPELLRTQVRAIFKAATFGNPHIMFPMIGQYDEWKKARQIVEEVRQEVGAAPIPVGMMIEVPSAAVLAEAFAPEVDFFSIGTNDLTQYSLAIDRQHPTLSKMSDGLHPAILWLIKQTADAAHRHGKWVGVCGELGADPQAVPILLGLGVDELSVNMHAVPQVKAQVRSLSKKACEGIAQKALHCRTAADVRSLIGD